MVLCTPEDALEDTPASFKLERPYFGLHRVEWQDTEAVNFYLGYGEWIRLLRANGFDVEDLISIQAPDGKEPLYPVVTAEWARQWPGEEIWKARKR